MNARHTKTAGRWVVRDGVLLTADSRRLATHLNTMIKERTA